MPSRSGPRGSSRNNDSGSCDSLLDCIKTSNKIINSSPQNNYRVLARKYRPNDFNELIGQDTLVKTFNNSLNNGRLAHAYLLTGIRGVGKTTTARIIAKALNCTDDGNKIEPTFDICNNCPSCISISNGNFLDVLEIDAASRTGVEGIREIIDSVIYSPNNARYKVYIIDEVHMLSNAAFNALLKTLEEPPQNVKFIFATTEIKKIPATIISRCQKFDLQRVDLITLTAHLTKICKYENILYEDDSILQICRKSEGSVRDALSLLDQAASLCNDDIKSKKVLNMLGLDGYEKNIQLFELCMQGNCHEALKTYDSIVQNGVQPIQIISNLLEICHSASKLNVTKGKINSNDFFEEQISKISCNDLSKLVNFWQILIKSTEEIRYAPNQEQAGSMTIIKLCYGSLLPDPSTLLKQLSVSFKHKDENINNVKKVNSYKNRVENKAELNVNDDNEESKTHQNPTSFEEMLSLLLINKESLLHAKIINNVHLVSFSIGTLKVRLKKNTDLDIIENLSNTLQKLTNNKWNVILSENIGEPTIAEKQIVELENRNSQIKNSPEFSEVFKHFPDAKIISVEDEN